MHETNNKNTSDLNNGNKSLDCEKDSNNDKDSLNCEKDSNDDKQSLNFEMDSIESKIKEQLDILFKEYRTPDPNITDKFYIKNIYESIETKKIYNIEKQIEHFGYLVFFIALIIFVTHIFYWHLYLVFFIFYFS